MADIGVVMKQKGTLIKQWECPFCGYITYTSAFETQAPHCPACVGSDKTYWTSNGIDKKFHK